MLSSYVLGTSPIHRLPAWVKLVAVAVVGVAVMLIGSLPVLAVAFALVIFGYIVAALPWRTVWPMIISVTILAGVIAGFQWWFGTPAMAARIGLRLLILIGVANLLTWTTRLTDLVDTIDAATRPLARLGVRTDRISIAIALALRFIPVISEQGRRIREAQAARGATAPGTFLVPLIVATVRMADGVGEALQSRGGWTTEPESR